MSKKTSHRSLRGPQILFIFPLVYRPLKDNFAGKFKHLSNWFGGHILALSGEKHRNLPISGFLFHSEKCGNTAATRLLLGLWLQIFVPLKMFWGRTQVDTVIAYDPYRSGLAALILKYLLRCKMIVEENGEYYGEYERNESGQTLVSKGLMRLFFNLSLRCADAIKVLNAEQEAYYRRLLPYKRIYRFPNFVATEYFQSLASYQGDYLLSVGYPFYRKGVDVLIEAFKLIAKKHRQIKLRIMGYCPDGEFDQYRAIADDHPRVEFIEPGWMEEVGEQMRGCYALVNAARSEAMGRVHIEAMACGKPIIATRNNGALLCVEDGQTGLLCAIGDIRDLAAKLDEMLSDPDRAQRMGQAGKMRMKEMFSENAYEVNFRTMFAEVTGTGPNRNR